MEEYIAKVKGAIQEAEARGHCCVTIVFYSNIFNVIADARLTLEQAFDGLGYSFRWREMTDKHGVHWATYLTVEFQVVSDWR